MNDFSQLTPENTLLFLGIGNPNEIAELSEKAGQAALCNASVLPKQGQEYYEALGIKVLDEHDNLFVNVDLPEGWKKESTSHPMWSNLLDEKGRKRLSIFYKADFWDRDAFSRCVHAIDLDLGVDTASDLLLIKLGGKEFFRLPIPRSKRFCDVRDAYWEHIAVAFPFFNDHAAYWDLSEAEFIEKVSQILAEHPFYQSKDKGGVK